MIQKQKLVFDSKSEIEFLVRKQKSIFDKKKQKLVFSLKKRKSFGNFLTLRIINSEEKNHKKMLSEYT